MKVEEMTREELHKAHAFFSSMLNATHDEPQTSHGVQSRPHLRNILGELNDEIVKREIGG